MTLPTRPDGGIDWENWLSKSMYGYSLSEVKQAATHARERCAKWHEEQAARQVATDPLIHGSEREATYLHHKESAAAHRKMED